MAPDPGTTWDSIARRGGLGGGGGIVKMTLFRFLRMEEPPRQGCPASNIGSAEEEALFLACPDLHKIWRYLSLWNPGSGWEVISQNLSCLEC
jgi:hypothetical protein